MKPHDVASVVRSVLPAVNVPDAVVALAIHWPELTRRPADLRAFADKIRSADRTLSDERILDLACEHGRESGLPAMPWAWDHTHRAVSRARGNPSNSKVTR